VAVGAAEGEPGQIIYRREDFFSTITLPNYQFGKEPGASMRQQQAAVSRFVDQQNPDFSFPAAARWQAVA
jgi:hypothetical protein